MKKKVLSVFLVAAMTLGLFAGCAGGSGNTEGTENASATDKNLPAMYTVNDLEENIIDDNYRTSYEVFVYSFCDSNGDGIGDLDGLTSKLDYINDGDPTTDTDLGCNNIWLMPIMPSTTYHKYDVKDYKDIDPEYGTLEDFDEFIAACHERGINVTIDLVMNHTSTKHEWFQSAISYLNQIGADQEPDLNECPYVDYYNFATSEKANYYAVGNSGWYYEGKFWSEMPDLNLENENVRQEFTDIVQFWLDRGVDGFRLDAVKEFYSGADGKNIDVLSWFSDMVKEKKSDAYIVGESWNDYNTYTKYYRSGCDSFFNFAFAENDGYIAKTLNQSTKSKASTYGKAIVAVQELIAENSAEAGDGFTGIDAPFYTNHDMGRSAGYYSGDYVVQKTKMAQAMNLLMSGNAFLYYGEELGMKGAGKDENKRLGMNWSTDENYEGLCKGPADADSIEQIYGSLEEQQDDEYSIYNFVKQVIKIRNAYPEIARGTVTFEESLSNEQVCVLTKEYNGKQIMLIYNLSETACEVDLSGVTLNGKNAGEVTEAGMLQTGEEAPSLDGSKVTLPAYSVELVQ